MIEFRTDYINDLPYDKEQYLDCLDDEATTVINWYGYSIQLDKSRINNSDQILNELEKVLRNIVLILDNGSVWLVNHDDKDLKWFPNDDDNLNEIRILFKKNNVPNSYRGALVLLKDDLFEFSHDLISYPYILSYKNLDISHGELQFIIKITSHLSVDLLSTDKVLLDQMVNNDILKSFKKVEYKISPLNSNM